MNRRNPNLRTAVTLTAFVRLAMLSHREKIPETEQNAAATHPRP